MEVEEEMMEREFSSMIIGQIYDDMINDYEESELEALIEIIDYYGTEKIRDVHKWITIPLKIDHEISGIDGNWAKMEEVK